MGCWFSYLKNNCCENNMEYSLFYSDTNGDKHIYPYIQNDHRYSFMGSNEL